MRPGRTHLASRRPLRRFPFSSMVQSSGFIVLECARRDEIEAHEFPSIMIDESHLAAPGGKPARQRRIAGPLPAQQRHDRADIRQILQLNPQQIELPPRPIPARKRHASEAEEARRVGAAGKPLGEARRNEIEILRGLGFGAAPLLWRKMRRLPLRGPGRPIVPTHPLAMHALAMHPWGGVMVVIVPVPRLMSMPMVAIMIMIELHRPPLTS